MGEKFYHPCYGWSQKQKNEKNIFIVKLIDPILKIILFPIYMIEKKGKEKNLSSSIKHKLDRKTVSLNQIDARLFKLKCIFRIIWILHIFGSLAHESVGYTTNNYSNLAYRLLRCTRTTIVEGKQNNILLGTFARVAHRQFTLAFLLKCLFSPVRYSIVKDTAS